MKTAGLVIDWRRPTDAVAALESLAAMKPSPDLLICIENGSTPSEVTALRQGAPPNSVVIELPENLGFPAAVNLGMEHAAAENVDWVLLLNNDATVSEACLARCLDEAVRDPGIAVVGPAVTFTAWPDRLWFAGGVVSDWFAYTRHRGLRKPTTQLPPSADTDFVSGCCALISLAAWRAVGPFRSDYFIYYEDAEWCQRARAAGWRCRYLGKPLCQHAVSATMVKSGSLGLSENAAYYLARNPLRFALETKDPIRRVTRVFGLLTIWAAYNAWRTLQSRRPSVARAYLNGLLDAFRGRMGRRPEN